MTKRETIVLAVAPEDRARAIMEQALSDDVPFIEAQVADIIGKLRDEGIGFCWLEEAA